VAMTERLGPPSRLPAGPPTGGARFTHTVNCMLEGDERSFVAVYRAIQPALMRYLTALVGPVEAEDVASETWAQACRDLTTFRGDGDGFWGWVTTIGRHRALDHLRARGRRPVAALRVEELLEHPRGDDAAASALESLATRAALGLIATLPQDQAEAVLLRAVMGLNAKTAGLVLGKRPGAVRSSAYRGLRALSARIADAEASSR
jgi:RNA polymerase sigma-70 factor (ECF subfamily)